ncbi:hypothetical protein CCACVL1_01096, partial [Corchorus capsularis]
TTFLTKASSRRFLAERKSKDENEHLLL